MSELRRHRSRTPPRVRSCPFGRSFTCLTQLFSRPASVSCLLRKPETWQQTVRLQPPTAVNYITSVGMTSCEPNSVPGSVNSRRTRSEWCYGLEDISDRGLDRGNDMVHSAGHLPSTCMFVGQKSQIYARGPELQLVCLDLLPFQQAAIIGLLVQPRGAFLPPFAFNDSNDRQEQRKSPIGPDSSGCISHLVGFQASLCPLTAA